MSTGGQIARGRPINVLHVCAEDGSGGAARAAYRVHRSLAVLPPEFGVRSSMLVAMKRTDDLSVHQIATSSIGGLATRTIAKVAAQERRLIRTPNPVLHSAARVPTAVLRRIEQLDPDVVLLHWLGSRTISIRQLGRLLAGRRPVAWRLPDTWAFCGAEHYPHGEDDTRFVDGYLPNNRLVGERGPDLNRRAWQRKRRHWTRPAQIIAPSRWMADLANRSALMGSWPSQVIPNPLDTGWWGASSRSEARRQLGIPQDRRVVLFGAVGGEKDPRKGADLLRRALPCVVERMTAAGGTAPDLLTFGGPPGAERVAGVSVRSVGRLDDEGLRLHYSAADVMVVPSRQEAFGQTASEAITCGTPVVAFALGGLPDIVEDGVNGRLAQPFEIEQLAKAIVWVLSDSERHARLSEAAREHAAQWDKQRVGAQYADVLRDLVAFAHRPNRRAE